MKSTISTNQLIKRYKQGNYNHIFGSFRNFLQIYNTLLKQIQSILTPNLYKDLFDCIYPKIDR